MGKARKKIVLVAIMIVTLIVAFCIGLSFGSTKIDISELIDAIRTNQKGLVVYRVFLYVRLPRVLAAMFAGAALAVSGVIIQGVLHNPLAGPNIIGVNSGAGFGAICAMVIFPYKAGTVPVMSFLGALITSLLIYLIALKSKSGKVTIVLAGVAISSILSAGIDALKTVFPDVIIDSNSFLVGGFSGISIKSLFPAVYYIIFGLVLAALMARNIDILGLGEEMAQTLGMNVKLNRFILIICSSMLAGAAVSFSGLLGFVGLIVPHIVRKYTGNNHKLLIPCSALMGASFVIICDLISRVLFVPYEIPVGIVMSFIGGPFFIILLLKGVKYNQ